MAADRRDPIRIGIVGAGIMARFHAETLADHPGAAVTAIASRKTSSADALAREISGCRTLATWEELVADDEIDVVIVATPDHLHADPAVAAVEAGKDVLIEKPLTTSSEDARRVVDAVRGSEVVAMTLFNHRWVPAYADAFERMRAGDLGTPVMAYAHKNDRIFVPTQMIGWAGSTTSAWFLSSHDIDVVTWLLDDRPTEVFATAVHGKLTGLGIDTPDAVQAQVRYAGGAVATFESCWIYPDTFPTMVDSYTEIVGTEGVIHLDRKREQIEVATSQGFEFPSTVVQRRVHGVAAGAVRDCLWHFLDRVVDRAEPLVTVEEAATVTAVLEAIHASTVSGKPEPVEAVTSDRA